MTERPDRRAGAPAAVALFVVYLVILVWLVFWKLGPPHLGEPWARAIKLVPFLPAGEFGASAPLEVVQNVAIFVPFGIYLALLAPRLAGWRSVSIAAGASLLLESGQWVLAVGSSDATDIITNSAGAAIGTLGVVLFGRAREPMLTAATARWLATATIAALLTVGFVAMPAPMRQAPGGEMPGLSSEGRTSPTP